MFSVTWQSVFKIRVWVFFGNFSRRFCDKWEKLLIHSFFSQIKREEVFCKHMYKTIEILIWYLFLLKSYMRNLTLCNNCLRQKIKEKEFYNTFPAKLKLFFLKRKSKNSSCPSHYMFKSFWNCPWLKIQNSNFPNLINHSALPLWVHGVSFDWGMCI